MHWSQLTAFETGITGALALLVWLGYIIFQWQHLPAPELALRSGLVLVGILCICCILWKPQYPTDQPTGKALVLTQPLAGLPDSISVFGLPSVPVSRNVIPVADLATLERNYPAIEQVYVAGYELEPEQLKALKRLNVRLLDNQMPPGFQWLAYNRTVSEGDSLNVSGTYENTTQDSLKIRLVIAERVQDSAMLAPGRTSFFLQGLPKVTGHYLAAVQLATPDSIRTEPLPFQVTPRQSLQIALVQAFPSFETNYLKDWLATQKHQVQAQAQVSREALAAQQINTNLKDKFPSLLSAQALKKTDLLILDEESLRRLSVVQQAQLKNAVEKGLGLLVLPQDRWLQKPAVFNQSFPLRATGVTQFMPASVSATRSSVTGADKFPYAFAADPLLIPVLQSRARETVAAFRPMGNGRIGAELATNTFAWILNGDDQTYRDFWTEIIQALSRKKNQPAIEVSEVPFLWQDQPARLHISDSLNSAVVIRFPSQATETIQPKREAAHGVTYPVRPVEAGWMRVQAGDDSTRAESLYVLPPAAWRDLRQAAFWRANQQFKQSEFAATSSIVVQKEIPLVWFFVPLVAALGLLWWREKTQKA
jgi:hypothetical protein